MRILGLEHGGDIGNSIFDDFMQVWVAQLRNIGLNTRFFKNTFLLHLAMTHAYLTTIGPSRSVEHILISNFREITATSRWIQHEETIRKCLQSAHGLYEC